MADLYAILPRHAAPRPAAPQEVGNKAWNLMLMAQAGLPVPPAFVLPTSWCRPVPPDRDALLREPWPTGIAGLEAATGLAIRRRAQAVAGLRPLGRRRLHAGDDGDRAGCRPEPGHRRGADPR